VHTTNVQTDKPTKTLNSSNFQSIYFPSKTCYKKKKKLCGMRERDERKGKKCVERTDSVTEWFTESTICCNVGGHTMKIYQKKEISVGNEKSNRSNEKANV
jgi:hypothetical protein